MEDVTDAIAFYDQRYEGIGNWILEPKKKLILGSKSGIRICRFCERRSPEVTFKLDAHAIPESLGNKSLLLSYECDTCNQEFGKGIENDFGNWSKPMRTFARIRGKKGVPTLKKEGPKGWRVEYNNVSGFTIKLFEDAPLIKVSEETNSVTFQLHRDAYTPIAVFKAFVKMGLSLMPESEMPNFIRALKWIKNPNHQVGLVLEANFPILYSFIPGPMPNDKIALFVYRRREGIQDVPYAFFILGYGNEVFQVFLPSPERDQAMSGKKFEIMHFPNPRDIYPSEFGPSKDGVLDLTGRGIVKDDVFSLTMGFDKVV